MTLKESPCSKDFIGKKDIFKPKKLRFKSIIDHFHDILFSKWKIYTSLEILDNQIIHITLLKVIIK
jgi:hypothetical protein